MGTPTRPRITAARSDASAPPPPAEPPDGEGEDARPARIGRYRIVGELGRGGMGVVYRAEDEKLGRPVAIKVLPGRLSADPEAKRRLLAEARAAAALDHPNVCAVHEIGEAEDGRLFLALACYDGEPLDARIARGPLAVAEAVAIGRGIARGLGAAHEKRIVHRDLKPSNVFLCADGAEGHPQPKILDFGIAKVEGAALTQPGATVGTVAYAAPELAAGRPEPRSDLWALGVVLYEMLTARRPFRGDYEAGLLYAILHEPPAPVRRLRPEVPPALEAVVMRCLEKKPEDRFRDAAELERALDAVLAGQRPARVRRRPAVLAVLGGAAVLAGVLVWPSGRQAAMHWLRPLPDERRIAVLPFAAPGADADERAFDDGLAEILSTELSGFERVQQALEVLPFSEVRAEGVASPGEARRRLGATLVVTGSVQRVGDRIRLPLTLTDAVEGVQLRSEVLEVDSAELADLQRQAIAALERMLEVQLADSARVRPDPNGPVAPDAYRHYAQGLGYLQHWDNAASLLEAVRLFQRALGEDPGFAASHARLGLAYWRLYEATENPTWVERAEAACETATTMAPNEPAAFVTLAVIRAKRGPPEEALRAARTALDLDSTNEEAHLALAEAHRASGNSEEAERMFREAVDRKPRSWNGRYHLGTFLYRRGRYNEALAEFREVLALAPDYALGHTALGNAYYQLGQIPRARQSYERSIERRPSFDVLSNLGTIYYDDHRYDDAVQMYRQALELQPDSYEVLGNLASAYEELPALRERAVPTYRAAIRQAEARRSLTPDNSLLLARLAAYYVEAGDAGRARAPIARALRLNPENPDVALDAATVYVELGEHETALRWARQALAGGVPLEYFETTPEFEPLLPALREQTP